MRFDPVNAPLFYIFMMGNFKTEWDALFIETLTTFANEGVKLERVSVTINGDNKYIGRVKLSSSTRLIIDDILI